MEKGFNKNKHMKKNNKFLLRERYDYGENSIEKRILEFEKKLKKYVKKKKLS